MLFSWSHCHRSGRHYKGVKGIFGFGLIQVKENTDVIEQTEVFEYLDLDLEYLKKNLLSNSWVKGILLGESFLKALSLNSPILFDQIS